MGWSTELFCNIHFNRKSYNSLYEVEEDIAMYEKSIRHCKDEIRTAVFMTEPDKLYNKDEYSSPLDFLKELYENNMEVLEENMYELQKLYYLKENWDQCHDKNTGLAVPPPDHIQWNTAYLDGDFIKTVQTDSSNNKCEDD